jgi:acyl-CoA thioesterase-1
MVNVPVESVTDLKTCSTEIIEEGADVVATSPELETTGSNMSALSENLKFTMPVCPKLGLARRISGLRPFGALLLTVLLGTPWLAHGQVTNAAAKTIPPGGPVILVLGDSLSAEYGLKRGTGWVALLEKQLAAKQKNAVKVVNASVSGDTTSGGRSRLPALLAQHKPTAVVIELGGNDALRGLPLSMTQSNLLAMTQAAKKAGAKVLLLGMQVPPNYGAAYGAEFAGLFSQIARTEKVALVPFFLKGIADVDGATANFQADRIHPNEQSQAGMLANVWPELKKLIK